MEKVFKGKQITCVIAITAFAIALIFLGDSAQAATGVNVDVHTPDEIRTYIKNNGGDINEAPVYATQPIVTGPNYSAGSLTDATQQNAIKVLNGVRYIAGIPYNVVSDSTYISQVQAGVLINYVNKKLTHTPEQPLDMSDELYNLGYKGTSSSNIEGGSGTSARALGKSIVYGWMGDGDSSNIDRVGHRRWCLNPSMGKTGFGSVWGSNGCYSAMYSFDKSNSTNITTVPWPAQNMPTEYFTSNSPWSVSRSTAFAAGTTVKLTRLEDNKVWNFSSTGETTEGYYSISNAGYGMTGCVIFRPSGVTGYYDGDAYRVQVTENGNMVIDYTVTFFDLENTTANATVKLSQSSGKISVTTDSYYHSGPTITLSDSSISFSKLSIVSSDESVVKAMVKTENTGSGWLYLKGIKDGVATITVSLSKTAYATYTVTVGNGSGHTHSYDAGVVTKAAACTATGVKTYTCSVCKAAKTESIPATGHTEGDWIIVKKPTATEKGSRYKKCKICGKTIVTEDIPVLPLNMGDTVSIKGMSYIITNENGVNAAVEFAGIDTEEYAGAKQTSITIPGTIVINGRTYKVTSIRKNAFKNNKYLQKVVIGRNIKVIGDSAFYGCKKLKQVTLSSKTTVIGKNAFANCKSLTKISIPASVTSIGAKAFYGCKKLKTITIKTKKLTNKRVGKSAFKGIAKKAKITVPKSKLKSYKKLLKKKGVSSKTVIKK